MAAIVVRRPGAQGHGGVLARVRRLEPGLHGGPEDEGLERGSGLAFGLGDAIEGAGLVIEPAHHGPDRAVGGQGHESPLRDVQALSRAGYDIAHRGEAEGLQARIDGQAHHQIM